MNIKNKRINLQKERTGKMTEGFTEEKEDCACYVGQPKDDQCEKLKNKIDILKNKLLETKPELEDWVKLHFGE